MKVRLGFVSNSSSSSFIVTPDNFENATRFSLDLVKVSSLIGHLISLKNRIRNGSIPDFVLYELNLLYIDFDETITELEEIVEKYGPDVCITMPFDRDDAYNIPFEFDTYRSDL
jgi:hypothetical protein